MPAATYGALRLASIQSAPGTNPRPNGDNPMSNDRRKVEEGADDVPRLIVALNAPRPAKARKRAG